MSKSSMGSPAELQAAWEAWNDKMTQEEQEHMAGIFASCDLSTLGGINQLAQKVIVEMFRGKLSPVAALAAKPWVELITANIHAQNAAVGAEQETGRHVLMVLKEVGQMSRPAPRYSIPAAAPLQIEASELEPEAVAELEPARAAR